MIDLLRKLYDGGQMVFAPSHVLCYSGYFWVELIHMLKLKTQKH